MSIEQYKKKYNQLLEPWRIEREIGSGSFGRVFEIRRNEFDNEYKAALKVITIPQNDDQRERIIHSSGMTEENAGVYFREMVDNLTKEISLLASLQGNTNIVSYADHKIIKYKDKLQWDILIRMELLCPFKEYASKHSISEEDVIKLGKDMCNALILCEKKGIIHRDIKPENIFVSDMGDFKLGDFGVARIIEGESGATTRVGTSDYMAPEVFYGEGHYDNRVDIYSLGLVMYKLLNGDRLPFLPLAPESIKYSDIIEARNKRMKGIEIPGLVNASKWIESIVLKACSFKPEERFQSPKEMLQALNASIYNVTSISKHDDVNERNIDILEDVAFNDEDNLFDSINHLTGNYSGELTTIGSNQDGYNSKNKKIEIKGMVKVVLIALGIIVSVALLGSLVIVIYAIKTMPEQKRQTDETIMSDIENDINIHKDLYVGVTEGEYSNDSFAANNKEEKKMLVGNEQLKAQSDVILVGDNTELILVFEDGLWLSSTDDFSWFSSDESIATVDCGVVRGLSTGDVVISARYQDKEYEYPMHVSNVDYGVGATLEVNYEGVSMSNRKGTTLTLSLLGNVPERFGLKCYASEELGLMTPQWGDLEENHMTLALQPSISVTSGEGEVTVILFPQDDPEHVVASKKIHVNIE